MNVIDLAILKGLRYNDLCFRGLAQLGSAPRSGRGGRGFKSRIPDQHVCYNDNHRRGVEQLVARLVWDQEVGGSSPLTPTILFLEYNTDECLNYFWLPLGFLLLSLLQS